MTGFGIILTNPVEVNIYDIWNKSICQINLTENNLTTKDTMLFNFNNSDERLFVQAGIATISMQTFLSMCCGYTVNMDEMNHIFQRITGIHYENVFCNKQVDFSILYSSPRFWGKIARLVCEGTDILKKQGMWEVFKIEVKITAVLHRMFDLKYPLDAMRVMKMRLKLQSDLFQIKKKLNNDKNSFELLQLRQKLEDKLRRIPCEIYNSKKADAVVSCNFRSIGTDTFRITTNHINIQGLPKEVRRCFLPRYGDMLVEYDLVSSQVIILACLAGEDSLIQLYEKGEDLYLYIAAALTGKQAGKITEKERGIYKMIILQILYGAGISTIQSALEVNGINFSYTKVREMQKRFYRSFPAVREYSDKVKTIDSIVLPTGRKWNLKTSVEPYKRLSYIMQYVESMLLREILVLLDRKARNNEIWLYLCIHDDVFIETNSDVYAEVRTIVRKCFNKAVHKYLLNLNQVRVKEDIIYDRTADIEWISKRSKTQQEKEKV